MRNSVIWCVVGVITALAAGCREAAETTNSIGIYL